jgi:hypothetical protein
MAYSDCNRDGRRCCFLRSRTRDWATWDELTYSQREQWRQAVEDGGTKTPTQTVTPGAHQLFLDARAETSPEFRNLLFRLRQKAGVLPRPYTIGRVDLRGPYTLAFTVGSAPRKKWFQFLVDPAPASGPWLSSFLRGVDHCGYLAQAAGYDHGGVWETGYHANDLVDGCPDRTVAIRGYYWPNGRRGAENLGPNPPDDGYVLSNASTSAQGVLRWSDPTGGNCTNSSSPPTGFTDLVGGSNTGCFELPPPGCNGSHGCTPHLHARYHSYFKDRFGQLVAEGDGNAPVSDVNQSLGDEIGAVDRAAIDREMRDPRNQPIVDWLHDHVTNALLVRYRPELRYDVQEPYRADSAAEITDNYVPGQGSNKLFDADHFDASQQPVVLASADPSEPSDDLSLSYLGPSYPNGQPAFGPADPLGGHYIDERNDPQTDAQRLHLQDRYANRGYGRVVTGSDGTTWLQYWFFYYYNDGFAGFGDHEADWEMIQVGLDAAGTPQVATYARHGNGHQQSCPWPVTPKYQTPEGDDAPVVYVDLGGHSASFEGVDTGPLNRPRLSEISLNESRVG